MLAKAVIDNEFSLGVLPSGEPGTVVFFVRPHHAAQFLLLGSAMT
jgi:hypothetical protein